MAAAFSRDEILGYLRDSHDDIKHRYSLELIALIGSIARDDYREDSDVDLIVRFKPGTERIHERKVNLRSELQAAFGRPVQIASEKYIRPYYRSQILKEAVYVQ